MLEMNFNFTNQVFCQVEKEMNAGGLAIRAYIYSCGDRTFTVKILFVIIR